MNLRLTLQGVVLILLLGFSLLAFADESMKVTQTKQITSTGDWEESSRADNCVLPLNSLIGWWPLDEPEVADSAEDIIGGNHGYHVGNPTSTEGKVRGAITLDGIDDYIEVPDADELDMGLADFSIEFWTRTSASSGVIMIMDKRDEGSSIQGYALFLVSGVLYIQLADGVGSATCSNDPETSSCTNYSSGVFIADGAWRHVAVTVDRDEPDGGTFYIDGSYASDFDVTIRDGSLANTLPLRIGCKSSSVSGFYNGEIDEFSIYDQALTPTDVLDIYNADSLGKCLDFCYATGDVNNDGTPLSVSDLTYLIDFIFECGLTPDSLHSADLNGDCVLDSLDIQMISDYMTYGMSVFDPYGGYPVLTCCDPSVEAMPDTVMIFDIKNVSQGSACLDTINGELIVSRLRGSGENGVIALLDSAFYGRGTSFFDNPNSESMFSDDVTMGIDGSTGYYRGVWETMIDHMGWTVDANFLVLPVGAALNFDVAFEDEGQPEDYVLRSSMVKTGSGVFDLLVGELHTVGDDAQLANIDLQNHVHAYRNGEEVFRVDSITSTSLGTVTETTKGVFPPKKLHKCGGKNCTTCSLGEKSSIAWDFSDDPNGRDWDWAEYGVSGLTIDYLVVSVNDTTVNGNNELDMVSSSIYGAEMDSFTVINEIMAGRDSTYMFGLYQFSGGFAQFDTTGGELTVMCNENGYFEGASFRRPLEPGDEDDGKWSIVEIGIGNPDPDGSLPDGAILTAGFKVERNTGGECDDLPGFRTSLKKIAPGLYEKTFSSSGTWAGETDIPYNIEAYNDDVLVFSGWILTADSLPSYNLGTFEETTRGIHPVGFKGTATGKPAHTCDSTCTHDKKSSIAWDYTEDPNGRNWNWPEEGIVDLQIDYLFIETADSADTDSFEIGEAFIYTYDYDSFTIISEVPTYQMGDIFVTPIGGAILDIYDDTLTVSDPDGDFGVEMLVWNGFDGEDWEIFMANPDPSDAIPVGAQINIEQFGGGIGFTNAPLGTGTATKTGSNQWEISSDFSDVGSSTQTVTVYNGETVVTTITGHTGPVATTNYAPSDYHLPGDDSGPNPKGVGVTYPPSTDIDVYWKGGKTSYVGDAIYMIPEGDTLEVEHLSKVEFMFSDIPSMTFTEISISSASCVCVPGDANSNGAVNILDITFLIAYLYLGGPAPSCMYEGDANGNCTVNILDITYLISYLYMGGPPPVCAVDCPGW